MSEHVSKELLYSVAEGEIPFERIAPHLEECERCKSAYDAAKEIKAACLALSDAPVPSGFTKSVMGRIRAAKKALIWRRLTAAAGTLCAVALAVILLARPFLSENKGFSVKGNAPEATVPRDPAPMQSEDPYTSDKAATSTQNESKIPMREEQELLFDGTFAALEDENLSELVDRSYSSAELEPRDGDVIQIRFDADGYFLVRIEQDKKEYFFEYLK